MDADDYFAGHTAEGSDHIRARLGAAIAHVAATGQALGLTDAERPGGALVATDVLKAAGLEAAGMTGVREARADWGALRQRAADYGPQALTHRGRVLAVLVDAPTAAALARGTAVLAAEELVLTGAATADGHPLAPGAYALPGGTVLHVAPADDAPPQPEETPVVSAENPTPEAPSEDPAQPAAPAGSAQEGSVHRLVELARAVRDASGAHAEELAAAARRIRARYDDPGKPPAEAPRPPVLAPAPGAEPADPAEMVHAMRTVHTAGGVLAAPAGTVRAVFGGGEASVAEMLGGHNLLCLPADLPPEDAQTVLLYAANMGGLTSLLHAVAHHADPAEAAAHVSERIAGLTRHPWEHRRRRRNSPPSAAPADDAPPVADSEPPAGPGQGAGPPERPIAAELLKLGTNTHLVSAENQRIGWLEHTGQGWRAHEAEGTATGQTDTPQAAVAALLRAVGGDHVVLTDLASGPLTDERGRVVETAPHALADWRLLRGRVSGREDVIVRGRCVGWLQPRRRGYTAHTTRGPVPRPAAATRAEAVMELFSHLFAPAPLPELGAAATTPRRARARPAGERPLCPYTQTELAAAELSEAADSAPGRRVYDVRLDAQTWGYVWRASGRRWQAAVADERRGRRSRMVVHRAATRTEAVDHLLGTPGPIWGDPDEALLH